MQIFLNILDLAEINGSILYKETGKKISRQDFLFQLREELATESQEKKQLRKDEQKQYNYRIVCPEKILDKILQRQ